MKERLQKIISHAGICSRRKAEELIKGGKVTVNGVRVTELGSEADVRKDKIVVLGEPIRPERLRYFLLNKPDRVITSVSDPQGRRAVFPFCTGTDFPSRTSGLSFGRAAYYDK